MSVNREYDTELFILATKHEEDGALTSAVEIVDSATKEILAIGSVYAEIDDEAGLNSISIMLRATLRESVEYIPSGATVFIRAFNNTLGRASNKGRLTSPMQLLATVNRGAKIVKVSKANRKKQRKARLTDLNNDALARKSSIWEAL